MNDPNLNTLLKWSVENSKVSEGAEPPKTQLNAEALAALFGGNMKSDAQMMKDNMEVIKREECDLEDRITAFDNFEQLIENLDNANNLESLNLWIPLIAQLESKEAEMRRYAAWCIGTAVQNNIKTQEKVSALVSTAHVQQLTVYSSWCLAPSPPSFAWRQGATRQKSRRRPLQRSRLRSGTSSLHLTTQWHTYRTNTSHRRRLMRTIWTRSIF